MVQNSEDVGIVSGSSAGCNRATALNLVERVDPNKLSRVVSIHNYGRSGSAFLASCFDMHPQVLTTPHVQISGFYEFWRRHGQLPALELLDMFLDVYKPMYKVHLVGVVPVISDCPSDGPPSDVDEQVFVDSLLRFLRREIESPEIQMVSRKYFLRAVNAAYAIALGREVHWESAVIVLSLHEPLPENVGPMLEDFPDARLLHTIRKPIQSLGSWYIMGLGVGAHGARLARVGICNMMTQGRPVFADKAENSRAVRLEDLNTAPRETLEAICAWSGLEWNDSLLESTFNGRPYVNLSDGKQHQGFHADAISKKKYACYGWFDTLRLKLMLSDLYVSWGYVLPGIYRSAWLRRFSLLLWWLPFRIEALVWKRDWSGFSFSKLGFNIDRYIELRRKVFETWRAWAIVSRGVV